MGDSLSGVWKPLKQSSKKDVKYLLAKKLEGSKMCLYANILHYLLFNSFQLPAVSPTAFLL